MPTNLDIAYALNHAGPGATVQDLVEFFPEDERTHLSARLCKMRKKGYCHSEFLDGKNYWTLTDKGYRDHLSKPAESSPPMEPEMSIEMSTPEPAQLIVSEKEPAQAVIEDAPEMSAELSDEPQPQPAPDPIARELLQAMELEVAMEEVRRRLRAPIIPARTARVYRELLVMLPPAVRDALAPMTALLGESNG